MSESRDAQRELAYERQLAAIRANPAWSHVTDPNILDYFAQNAPAGFNADANSFTPGQVLDPSYVGMVINRLNQPGYYNGVSGMDLQKYLADPRSVVKVENGKFVYRPELAKPVDSSGVPDFISTDRESFMQSLGALPFVLGGFAAPYLSSLGVIGPGAGVMGSTGNMQFLGDMANVAGAAEGAAGAAGSSASEIPMGEFSNLLTTTTPQAPPAATWESSLGLPSLDAPIQSVLEPLATTPTNAALGQSLGLPSGGLDAILQNTGMTMTNPLGASLAPVTVSAAGDLLSNVAGGAASSLGTQVAGSAGTTGVGAAASTVPQTASSALSQFLKDQLGLDVSPGMLNLLGQGLGAGLGMLSSNQQTSALQNLASQMNQQRAPFLNKATGYLNDPNSFYSSPEATGAASAVLRQLSATHGNPMGSPTAQSLATGALYDRYLNTVNSLGSLGLGGEGIQANLGQQVAQSQGQPWAIAGNAVSSLTSDNSMQNMLKKMFQQQFSLA